MDASGLAPPFVLTDSVFLPLTSPVTTPTRVRGDEPGRKAAVTSRVPTTILVVCVGTSGGTVTCTNTSPPVTRAASVESVLISILSAAVVAPATSRPALTATATTASAARPDASSRLDRRVRLPDHVL